MFLFNCREFEFIGILCRHIVRVYIITNVQNLHSQYMLKHWTRDAKIGAIFNDEKPIQEGCQSHLTQRYNTLCHETIEVATEGSSSLEVFKVILYWFQKAKNEVHNEIKKQIDTVSMNKSEEMLTQV